MGSATQGRPRGRPARRPSGRRERDCSAAPMRRQPVHAGRAAGGEAKVQRLAASPGARSASRNACSACRVEAGRRRRRRTARRPPADGRSMRHVHADLVRAAGLAACSAPAQPCVAAVEPLDRRARRLAGCAPGRPPPCAGGCADRGRSARRPARVRAPCQGRCASARYCRVTSRAAISAHQRVHRGAACAPPPSGRWCPCRAGARCRRAAAVGALRVERQQAVEQRAAPVARRRMHHQAGRLVDHEQVRRPRAPRAAASAPAGRPGSAAWAAVRWRRRRRPARVATACVAAAPVAARPRRPRSAAAGSCARTRAPVRPARGRGAAPCCAAPMVKARVSARLRRRRSSSGSSARRRGQPRGRSI